MERRKDAALLAGMLGRMGQSASFKTQAELLQDRFESAFWCDDLSTYALALDGDKRPCRVRTSNAGQCLFSGIALPAHARRVAETLLAPESFSGWGIRSVAASEARYNPMGYHNGGVRPHDNALIAYRFSTYGMADEAARVLSGMFEAAMFFNLHRVPELFCGFSRDEGEGPIPYPVACAPQSWSAASTFLLLQACTGLRISGPNRKIFFVRPLLPEFLNDTRILNLEIGDTTVDLELIRHGHGVSANVLRRQGDVEIVVVV